MKWLLVAIFCVSAASATTLVGGNPCTWGPAYWCHGLENAKKCSAVTHCANNVWKKEPVTEVGSTESCLVCKGIIQDLQTLIAAKKTQDEIKALGLKACSLLHNEKTAEEVCNTVVIMFLPEVIQMIESEVDPAKICGLIHLCGSSKLAAKFNQLTTVLKAIKTHHLAADNCAECKLAVTMVKTFLSQNDTQVEIIQFVNNQICTRLPGEFSTICKKVAAELLPQVFQNLEQIMDPQTICGMFGLCPKTVGKSHVHYFLKKLIGLRMKANPLECDLCKTGIADLRTQLRDASLQKEVENFLKTEVCTHLGSLAVQCQQGVTQYLPLAFQLIVNELDPDTTCKALGLCSTSVKKVPMMSLRRASVVSMRQPKATPQCVLCEFVMSKIEGMIGNNKTEEAIESALEKVCSILPQTIRAECDNFVETYGKMVIKLILSELSPKVICSTIGLCATPPPTKSSTEVCPVMMRYFHILSEELHMSHESLVIRGCRFVPKRKSQDCKKFVTENKNSLLKLEKNAFKAPFEPTELCKRLTNRPNGLVHLLGRSKCTYGPAYWCASHKNAKECGAMKHCEERVWKKFSKIIF